MLQTIYKIKDTIDVFVSPTESHDKFLVTFHKMTTRARIEIIASKHVVDFIALIDGKKKAIEILCEMGGFDSDSVIKLVKFLLKNKIIADIASNEIVDVRYKRQVSYFDDFVSNKSGVEAQKNLQSKKIISLGCGSVGSSIVEILARAGVENFVLLDYKKITQSNVKTHFFSSIDLIGRNKATALSHEIKKINSKSHVVVFDEMLFPHTDLSKIIPDDASIVINSCDEPYIGHTSLKIGRYLHQINIPLYVAGGFDAHLMSSGELIFPPHTPCVDCAQQTFTEALGDWKPTYLNVTNKHASSESKENFQYVAGGAGKLCAMSLFSANMAALKIINFLLDDDEFDFTTNRYEYLINSGEITSFKMKKQKNCHVCNK